MSWFAKSQPRHSIVAYALIGLTCLVVGCSDAPIRRGRVHGTVTVDGKPLANGQIRFFALTGGIGTDGVVKEGNYDIPLESGMSAGKYRVELSSERSTGRKIPDYDGAADAMKDEIVEDMPPNFNQNSTLQIDFDPEKDEPHNFDLKR